jgi:hypothetical protein
VVREAVDRHKYTMAAFLPMEESRGFLRGSR